VRECQFGFPEYVRRSYLFDPSKRLLPDDKLTLDCEASWLFITINSENCPFQLDIFTEPASSYCLVPSSFDSHLSKITQDFAKLLDGGKLRDVTLTFGDKELRAHKDILGARSTVFSAMFEHESNREVQEGRVCITDVEFEVFREMLRFIYTGRVEMMHEWADRLLAAADKYDLSDLKAQCEDYLCAQISVESASNLLLLADMFNCARLKATVIGFFHK